jgi:hypothetical protein
MALDESTEGLEKLTSNGISAYIDPGLKKFIDKVGAINVDFVDQGDGQRGFTVRAGNPEECGPSDCGGCPSGSH